MFENLTDKLEKSFKILKGQGKITEINIADSLKEVRRALLDADVNYKIAKEFTDTVKQKALGADVIKAVKPGEMMVKLVHDELVNLMGVQKEDMNLQDNMNGPHVKASRIVSSERIRKMIHSPVWWLWTSVQVLHCFPFYP